jgi:hypothetical protein
MFWVQLSEWRYGFNWSQFSVQTEKILLDLLVMRSLTVSEIYDQLI